MEPDQCQLRNFPRRTGIFQNVGTTQVRPACFQIEFAVMQQPVRGIKTVMCCNRKNAAIRLANLDARNAGHAARTWAGGILVIKPQRRMRRCRRHDPAHRRIRHHLARIDDQLCLADAHLKSQCAKPGHILPVTDRRGFSCIHDHKCASAADPQKAAIGGLLQRLAAHAGAQQRFLDMRSIDAAAAIEMRQPSVAMTPHADEGAHAGYHVAKQRAVDTGSRGSNAQFHQLAHQRQIAVRHAADMAAIGQDHAFQLWHDQVQQCRKFLLRYAKGNLGKGKSAQRTDLVFGRPHAPPVSGKTVQLHVQCSRQIVLKLFGGGMAIPAVIQCQYR